MILYWTSILTHISLTYNTTVGPSKGKIYNLIFLVCLQPIAHCKNVLHYKVNVAQNSYEPFLLSDAPWLVKVIMLLHVLLVLLRTHPMLLCHLLMPLRALLDNHFAS